MISSCPFLFGVPTLLHMGALLVKPSFLWALYGRGMGALWAHYGRVMGALWALYGRSMGAIWARYGRVYYGEKTLT